MTSHCIVMAGTSPRRVELLSLLGVSALAVPHGLDEATLPKELPALYAARMARDKVQAVAAQYAGQVILAADTVVACGRRILPKAETVVQAEACLKLLSGRAHRVYTAVAVIDATGTLRQRTVLTRVQVKRLSLQEHNMYVQSQEWQSKAGGYALQGIFAAFVPKIVGSYHAVLGLPLFETRNLLAAAGV